MNNIPPFNPHGHSGYAVDPNVSRNNGDNLNRGGASSAEQHQTPSMSDRSPSRQRPQGDHNRGRMLLNAFSDSSAHDGNQPHATPRADDSPHHNDSTECLDLVLKNSQITAKDDKKRREKIKKKNAHDFALAVIESTREAELAEERKAAEKIADDELIKKALRLSLEPQNQGLPAELPVSPPHSNLTPESARWSGGGHVASPRPFHGTQEIFFELGDGTSSGPQSPQELEGSLPPRFELAASAPSRPQSPQELRGSSPPPAYTER